MSLTLGVATKPYKAMRYSTAGDWRWRYDPFIGDWLHEIDVAALPDWRMEACVAVHEIVEALLCRHRGISEEAVTAFDRQHEADMRAGIARMTAEPGDDPKAPYFSEHAFAMKVERMLADEFGLDWDKYEAAIAELEQ